MGRKPETSRPSFFKILIKEDYTTKLMLPQVFVQKFRKLLPEIAKLRTSCQEIWDVKLEETKDDNQYCFAEGWSKFVKDLDLKLGEFLVFWFNIGDSTFDVLVYGINCCERAISAKNSTLADENPQLRNENHHNVPGTCKKRRLRSWVAESEDEDTDGENYPRFQVVLTETRKSRLCLPKKFAEACHLINKKAVVLEYPPKRRYWPVILDCRQRPYFSQDMAAGWNAFRQENRLVFGRTYSFEFNSTKNVIQVKEEKER